MTISLPILRTAPEKPKEGQPCNGCGFCCASELCAVAEFFHGKRPGPCPEMVFNDDRFWCGVMLRSTDEPTRFMLTRLLGFGVGCDSED